MSIEDKQQMILDIESALDNVRPHLKADGGNIEVIDISEDYVLKIKWLGNCEGCSMSMMTMRAGIEQAVRGKVPKITKVEAVNGLHAA